MSGTPVFLEHPSSLEHDTGEHPEHARRIAVLSEYLAARRWLGFERLESPAVQRSVLECVHPSEYVQWIEELSLRGGGMIDLDTLVSEGSFEAALHAAGGAVRIAELLVGGQAPAAFSAHRPPGHHASARRAMGFCLFNNIAIAARHALTALALSRVLIVDWDVHHGNGTSEVFWESPEVLFVSIHQSPLYPGTGAASEVGGGSGTGYTVNLPVPPGSGDEQFVSLTERVVVPLARAFEPQLVLISAGYDGHRLDPLADCRLTEAGFAAMAAAMAGVCAELSVPVGCMLEGGYEPAALARSVAATMEALTAPSSARADGRIGTAPLAASARERLREWWPQLG